MANYETLVNKAVHEYWPQLATSVHVKRRGGWVQ